jgi:hypothetical protein
MVFLSALNVVIRMCILVKQVFGTTWSHNLKFKVPEGPQMKQDLLGDLKLWRNDSNVSIGDRTLIPRKGILKEEVELRNWEGRIILLLRDTILGAQSSTSSYINLWLRRLTDLLAVKLGNQVRMDITKEKKRGQLPRGRVPKIILRQPQSHTKTPFSVWEMEDHVRPVLPRHIPTICVLLGVLFQNTSAIWQSTCCSFWTKRLLIIIWELVYCRRVVWQNLNNR